MAALTGKSTDVLRILVQCGADVNECVGQHNDSTPLNVAVRQGHEETVRVLLQLGADPNLPS